MSKIKKGRTIKNLNAFLKWRGFANDEPYTWARCFYKYTDCGPWAMFLLRDKDARDEDYEPQTARFRSKAGKAILENVGELTPKFVQFLGYDDQGLSKKERTWKAYNKLVDAFAADEAKQERTGREIAVTRPTKSTLHVTTPGYTEHFKATVTEAYYEDLRKCKTTWKEVDCGCKLQVAGTHPDDPAEDVYAPCPPDPKCPCCHGAGRYEREYPTAEPLYVVNNKTCVGIKFGSIVEGSDVDISPYVHMFPFNTQAFEDDIADMEAQTSFYWKRDNATWYQVRTEDDEWVVANVWGDIEWDGEEPPAAIKEAAEKAIKADWVEDPKWKGAVIQTIPKMPSIWEPLKDSNKDWQAMPLGDTGAEIYTFEDDSDY